MLRCLRLAGIELHCANLGIRFCSVDALTYTSPLQLLWEALRNVCVEVCMLKITCFIQQQDKQERGRRQ